MAKEDTMTKVMQVVVIGIIFSIYFFLISGNPIVDVEQFNARGVHTGGDKLLQPASLEVAQNIFGATPELTNAFLQASAPLDDNDDTMVFRILIDNPFEESVEVAYVDLYRNGQKLNRRIIRHIVSPGGSYLFKTANLPIVGKETQVNLFRLAVLLKKTSGEETIVNYDYQYYLLNTCSVNSDCEGLTNVCDTENVARFSTTGENYCVRTCENNGQCFEGQLCIRGRCGY